MNGAQPVLKRVFVIGRLDRAMPGAVELLQHFLGRAAAGIENPFQRLEMAAFIAAAAGREAQAASGQDLRAARAMADAAERSVESRRVVLVAHRAPDDARSGREAVKTIA